MPLVIQRFQNTNLVQINTNSAKVENVEVQGEKLIQMYTDRPHQSPNKMHPPSSLIEPRPMPDPNQRESAVQTDVQLQTMITAVQHKICKLCRVALTTLVSQGWIFSTRPDPVFTNYCNNHGYILRKCNVCLTSFAILLLTPHIQYATVQEPTCKFRCWQLSGAGGRGAAA